jgi:hypothetical protein
MTYPGRLQSDPVESQPVRTLCLDGGIIGQGLDSGAAAKLLAKAADERYQTAGEVVAEVERIGKFQGVTA